MATVKFIAYAVTPRGEGEKDRWTRIGAAFENKDGSLTVLLDAAPLSGKLILQAPKEEAEAAEASS